MLYFQHGFLTINYFATLEIPHGDTNDSAELNLHLHTLSNMLNTYYMEKKK